MSEEFDLRVGPSLRPCAGRELWRAAPALLAVAAILLVVLGLVVGMAVARMVAEDERRKAAVAIYQAVL